MRIDYSEPKKSCSVPAKGSQSRPRQESSSSGGLFAIVITGILCLGIGFGGGWMLSQRSTKKAFKAAMEQQNLESSPQQFKAQQPTVQQLKSFSIFRFSLNAKSSKGCRAAGPEPLSGPPLHRALLEGCPRPAWARRGRR